ncbi:hypothetical protein OQA88_8874 [Cercophora sp. LCS_1]
METLDATSLDLETEKPPYDEPDDDCWTRASRSFKALLTPPPSPGVPGSPSPVPVVPSSEPQAADIQDRSSKRQRSDGEGNDEAPDRGSKRQRSESREAAEPEKVVDSTVKHINRGMKIAIGADGSCGQSSLGEILRECLARHEGDNDEGVALSEELRNREGGVRKNTQILAGLLGFLASCLDYYAWNPNRRRRSGEPERSRTQYKCMRGAGFTLNIANLVCGSLRAHRGKALIVFTGIAVVVL